MEPDYFATLKQLYSGRYWALIGVEPVTVEPGHVINRLTLRPEHMNYIQVAHGGLVSSMIDIASGAAVGSLRTADEIQARPHATSDLHVSYFSGASGAAISADARVIKVGRTAVFTEVKVRDDRGRIVAQGMVTYVISARGSVPAA